MFYRQQKYASLPASSSVMGIFGSNISIYFHKVIFPSAEFVILSRTVEIGVSRDSENGFFVDFRDMEICFQRDYRFFSRL